MAGGAILLFTKAAVIIFTALFISVRGQTTTAGLFSQQTYTGTVLKYLPRHHVIVEVRVNPNPIDISITIQQDSIVYYSYNINEQFYLHSQLGRVAVNTVDLTEGDYVFTVYANYTTGNGVMETVSATVRITVSPEFYFVGTEPEGGYLAYTHYLRPLGAHVITIRTNYTRLTDTVFSYALAPDTNTINSRVVLSPDGLITRASYSVTGLQQFTVICTANSSSAGVVETLSVNVTIVLYDPLDLQVEVGLSGDVIRWSQPNMATAENNYGPYLSVQQFVISVAVYNGDFNSTKNPSTNIVSSQTHTFQYQPLIPQTTLAVNVTTFGGVDALKSVTVTSTNNFTIPGDVLQTVTEITINQSGGDGELYVSWQLLSVNVTGYSIRLSYDESQAQTEGIIPVERVGNTSPFDNSFLFTSLPGNTTYTIIVVTSHLNGQRVLSTPIQYSLPGYAPSVSPTITAAWYLPDYNVRVEWTKVFFSNGDVQSYTVEFTSNTNVTMTQNTSDTIYQRSFPVLSEFEFVDVVVRAVNLLGSSLASSPQRIFISGVIDNITVTDVTDTSACFTWYPATRTMPSSFTIRINGDPVVMNLSPTPPPQTYCETRITSGTLGNVIIQSTYPSSVVLDSSRVEFHTVNPIFNFTATSPTSVSVLLEWSRPAPILTSRISPLLTGYEIQLAYLDPLIANPVMMTTSRRPVFVESLTLTTSLNYTLLQPGIEYTAVLIATFSGGQKTRSPPATFTTLVNSPPSNRPASIILVSYNTTSQLAVFQWSIVYYSNGPIVGYYLYTDDTDPDELQGATNNIAEVNIRNNSPLTVRVTAVNSAGEGPQTVQNINIDVAPRAYHYMINNTAVRLFWDPPSYFITDIMNYNVIARLVDSPVVETVTLDANSYIFSGLSFNTLYTFQVIAVYPSATEESNLISIQSLGPVCSPNCRNGGICINDDVCMCQDGFTGGQCEAVYCNPPCPYNGSCDTDTLTCDCSTVTIGGNEVCFGGRINSSCQCDCYDGLFTGENCTESLGYEATIVASPTSNGQDLDISIIPPDQITSETTIQEYRLRITGGDGVNVEVANISAQMSNITISLPFNNNPFSLEVRTRFTIDEHHNNDVFTVDSEPVVLSILNCGSNMFGGFNGTGCQSCPMDTGNNGGFTASSCECIPGYTASSNGMCVPCNEGTFKPNTGNGPCVTCSGHMYSLVGAVTCACDIGHEVVASLQNICSPCKADHYKDTVANITCTHCPKDSSSLISSTSLRDCQCDRSLGNAQDDGCYAFQNGTSVTTPDSSQISSTWVVISWTPLTTVTDTRGNSNPVAGFYIFYQPVGVKRVAVSGSVNVTGDVSSANVTNLEEGTQYDVTVSPYIGGFQLGPPTNIIINTSPLVNNINGTTTITVTTSTTGIVTTTLLITTVSATPAPTASTSGGDGDSTTMIIIIAAAAAGAVVLLLLIIICALCVVCKRKKHRKATISVSTKTMMKKNNKSIQSAGFKKVTSVVVMTNPSFVENADSETLERKFAEKEPSPFVENMYTDVQAQSHNRYEEQRARYLEISANTIAASTITKTTEPSRMATPEDYDNEALYEKMSAHYFVVDEKTPLKSKEMARNRVTLLEQLGKGEYGRVMKGLASGIMSGETNTVVAVKMLKEGASEDDKKNFLGEAHMLAQFSHPNVLALLGVVTVGEPMLVVTPFMKNGDLRSFLSKNAGSPISNGDKLDIAVQIASGMEYLAVRFFIHRDLAARNILVDEKLHAKISDFGLSRILAKEDTYYKLSNVAKLPVKWMALESIEYRKFSTFSDVWSYGVVLWEIFSLGKIPYKGVPNATLPTYLSSGKRLEQPNQCSDEIYHIMEQCWLLRKERRPTFGELKKEITELLAKEGRTANSDLDMYSLYI